MKARLVWLQLFLGLVLVSLLLAACASARIAGTATPEPTGITRDVGYLEGRATIGPLSPVERVDAPSPTPPPQVCAAAGLSIFQRDGTTEVESFNLHEDCTYRLALTPGTYVVRLRPESRLQFSKDLPKTVEIESGRTTRLDFSIDTGIR